MIMRLACLLSLVLFLMGCSTTELVSSWKNPQLSGYQRILAIGISENVGTRRIFEDSFAAEAQKAGLTAIPSYTVLPEAGRLQKSRIAEAVKKTSADGVLIMRLLTVDRHLVSSPGYYSGYAPYPYYGGPAYGYYDWAWRGYYEPPRIYEEVSVILETTIYDAKTSDVVWSGKTRTIDPTHLDNEMHEVSKVIVEAMQKQGVIGILTKPR